tara:strand:- start:2285 stop:3706 length:1422 start_codon:yes stop_codon:yes gene_type:complete
LKFSLLPVLLGTFAVLILPLKAVNPRSGRPPNIVLIVADDLGYGDLGCFGQKVLRTPRLDAMAAQGMRLTQFYAGSTVCAPSRSVLMTGRHMGRTVVRGNSTKPIVLREHHPTVASVLKKAGYRTACVGKWGLGTPDNLSNPNDVGFDHFFGYVDMWHAHNFYPEFLVRNGQVQQMRNEVAPRWKSFQEPGKPQAGRGVAVKRVDYAPDLFIAEVEQFIRDSHRQPFFLFHALNTPHANNEAGSKGMEVPELGEFSDRDWPAAEKGFAAMIRNIDRDAGRVLDLLEELKIEKDTLVIFTSDNGPHNEGGHRSDFFDSNGPLRGTKRDLTEGGIRVPTIAWWPGTIDPGTEDGAHWYFGDLMATFAELAGVEPPANIDSDSFAAPLRGQPRENRWLRKSLMYWEFYERGSAQAVRLGKWKAIRKPMFTGKIELYDISNDPGETTDLSKRHPDLTKTAIVEMNKAHEPDPNWPAK